MDTTGMIVLGHGSRRREVGEAFTAMVGRVARQLPGMTVLPAFFSLGEPTLADQVRRLASGGCSRIVIMQYFLYNGVHIEQDIPEMIAELRREMPGIEFVVQPTLQDDPAMERLIADRLLSSAP
ncbi:sirohydrochlorin chelatase [Desulfomicrobium escambiense]|uniref:sirohydrochlorin chelatase n=1 Tax=Desulfomicrobium escambiense TaxID=29503 RepID=UPI00041C6CE2|nr:CbiX/SirB N-terminal domain-containing protein [Desulfomicrobium escambiense]